MTTLWFVNLVHFNEFEYRCWTKLWLQLQFFCGRSYSGCRGRWMSKSPTEGREGGASDRSLAQDMADVFAFNTCSGYSLLVLWSTLSNDTQWNCIIKAIVCSYTLQHFWIRASCIHIRYICIWIYIYIYVIERERDRCIDMYIYIYIQREREIHT